MNKRLFFIICFVILLTPSLFSQMNLVLQTANTGSILKTQFHPTANYLLSVDDEGTIVIWDMKQRKQYASFNFTKHLKDVSFVNDSVIVVSVGGSLQFWDFTNNQLIQKLETSGTAAKIVVLKHRIIFLDGAIYYLNEWNSEKINRWSNHDMGLFEDFYISENGKTMALLQGKSVLLYDFESKINKGEIKTTVQDMLLLDSLNVMSIATKSSSIITYNYSEKIKKKNAIVNNRRSKHYKAVGFAGNKGVVGNANDIITIYDLSSGKIIKNFKNHGFSIHSLSLNQSGTILAVGSESGQVKIYDVDAHKEIVNLVGLSAVVNSIYFMPDSVTVLLGYDNGQIKSWNLKTHQIHTAHIPKGRIDRYRQANYSLYSLEKGSAIAYKTWQGGLLKKQTKGIVYRLKIDENLQNLELKKYKEHIFPEASFNKLIRLNKAKHYELTSNSKPLQIDSTVVINDAALSLNKAFILASATDGMIYFIDAETGDLLLQMFSSNDEDFFYATTEGYYFSSKTALKSVGVRYKDDLLSFEQIDLLYNRPDKVLKLIGYSSPEYIQLLETAYYKRLRKLGADENELSRLDNLPTIKSNIDELPIKTKTKEWRIHYSASSTNDELKAIHVFINGIPIYGKEGVTINGSKAEGNLDVTLTQGKNHIQLFAEATNGLKSIRENSHIDYTISELPNLYVLTIGSGTFTDSSFDLTYASKDAKDMANLFQESKYFKQVNTKTLVDINVNNENIEHAISWLQQAQINDVVIVFFAGHGILDDSLDYYLSATNIDFVNPQNGGILYTNLENKIGALRCRNKVLFVDACHSGEVDKEEIALTEEQVAEEGGLVFRAVGAGVEHIGGSSTFELSKNLFADLRQNNGVVVTSSAGGAEYALEGSNWSNGVFTYSLIDGLQSGKADLNGDKKITLTELQKYLSVEVPKLTQGKQTPTSRVEILEQDIRIW